MDLRSAFVLFFRNLLLVRLPNSTFHFSLVVFGVIFVWKYREYFGETVKPFFESVVSRLSPVVQSHAICTEIWFGISSMFAICGLILLQLSFSFRGYYAMFIVCNIYWYYVCSFGYQAISFLFFVLKFHIYRKYSLELYFVLIHDLVFVCDFLYPD